MSPFQTKRFFSPSVEAIRVPSGLKATSAILVLTLASVRSSSPLAASHSLIVVSRLLERDNSALVDLFDLDHAEKVLGLFGKAYGKLPYSVCDWSSDQQEFIRQAVLGLSQDRKVILVRIAVFADLMKSRDWTTAALREVGGNDGVGVTFLEETFAAKQAPIQHRQHQEADGG